MTTNDFDRTTQLWLDDGPTQMSDRALQAALDEIHVTPQRRAWWPARRTSAMGNRIRLAMGAAAVLLAAVVGIYLVSPHGPGLSGGGPGGASPTPTPTASPTPSPTLSPLVVGENARPLAPGTYTAADPFPLKVTFTVPAGWQGNIGGPYAVFLKQAAGPGTVNFSIFDKVYADPCHYKGLLAPLPGPSVDDLASALASLPGVAATAPTAVSMGGYEGKQLTLTAPASFVGCTLTQDAQFRIWELPLGATNDMTAGEVDRVWILDAGGQRLVIDAPEFAGQAAATTTEVQGILDSIHISKP